MPFLKAKHFSEERIYVRVDLAVLFMLVPLVANSTAFSDSIPIGAGGAAAAAAAKTKRSHSRRLFKPSRWHCCSVFCVCVCVATTQALFL